MNQTHVNLDFSLVRKFFQFTIKIVAVSAIFTATISDLYAQKVYKSVDKNGRITYSEVPPLPGTSDKLTGESTTSAPLPYALQQIVSRYPVVLYTTANCPICSTAKIMLTQRGVPFTERTVSSNKDIDAYKKLNADNTFPLATIAAQQLKGYEENEWTKYLDAAGYPKSSTLPRNYTQKAATPLVEVAPKKAAEKPIATEKPAEEALRPAPASPNNNPAGIKF